MLNKALDFTDELNKLRELKQNLEGLQKEKEERKRRELAGLPSDDDKVRICTANAKEYLKDILALSCDCRTLWGQMIELGIRCPRITDVYNSARTEIDKGEPIGAVKWGYDNVLIRCSAEIGIDREQGHTGGEFFVLTNDEKSQEKTLEEMFGFLGYMKTLAVLEEVLGTIFRLRKEYEDNIKDLIKQNISSISSEIATLNEELRKDRIISKADLANYKI